MLRRERGDVALGDCPPEHALDRLVAVGVEYGVAAVEVDDIDARLVAEPARVTGRDELEPPAGVLRAERIARRPLPGSRRPR